MDPWTNNTQLYFSHFEHNLNLKKKPLSPDEIPILHFKGFMLWLNFFLTSLMSEIHYRTRHQRKTFQTGSKRNLKEKQV